MTAIAARRRRNFALTGLAALVLVLLVAATPALGDTRFLTGWLLVTTAAALLLFNLRKKIPVLPLLPASTWLQLHSHAGLVAALLFALHTGFRLPGGPLQRALWGLFVLVAASGIVGWWLERTLTPRLRSRGEAVLFARIPTFRSRLASEVEALVERSVAEISSPVLTELYGRRIAPFMAAPRNFLSHLAESQRPLEALRSELRAVDRYLSPKGRGTLAEIDERIVAKDSLDYQHAILLTLRGWLFLHVPLAYGIFPLIAVHIVLVYSFAHS
ncbi:MAG: hypothetical protein ACHQF3_06550 [Alphaproteobacteria bacterium]